MKAAGDLRHELLKLKRVLSSAQRQGNEVQVDPIPQGRWQGHLDSLQVAIDLLEDPGSLLSDEELLEAVSRRPAVRRAVIDSGSKDELHGAMFRAGHLVLEHRADPAEGEQKIRRAL